MIVNSVSLRTVDLWKKNKKYEWRVHIAWFAALSTCKFDAAKAQLNPRHVEGSTTYVLMRRVRLAQP